MSAPTRAGPTCRCPAASSRCCGGWSTCPATPRSPARALRARRPMSRPWRRCAPSTVSAHSGRRPRPPSRCRRITPTAPHQIIRQASTAPPMVRSRATRWPRPIASRSSIHPRFAPRAPATPTPNPASSAGLAALWRRRTAAATVLLALILSATSIAPSPTRAESNDEFAIKAVSQTRLAYVVTGNADVDSIVKAGMAGLTLFLAQRTALEAGDPVGIDPARDELAFFPLIYWPIVPGAPKPPQDAINRIDAYMKQGGTVLFDTRDAVEAPPGENGASQTPGMRTLREILSSLDVPELEPVPREHVLTKTFYLLRDFPGRFNTGQTWVETLPREDDDDAASRPARGGDGVSPIIITSNDLAGAWAHRPDGQPMLPLTPGEPRQREFAFRSGVNIVMYTLTGNYKADPVPVPDLN